MAALAEEIKQFNERLKVVTARQVELKMIPATPDAHTRPGHSANRGDPAVDTDATAGPKEEVARLLEVAQLRDHG